MYCHLHQHNVDRLDACAELFAQDHGVASRRNFPLQVCCNARDDRLARDAARRAADARLQLDHVGDQVLCRVGQVADFGVRMQAKHLGRVDERELVNRMHKLVAMTRIRWDLVVDRVVAEEVEGLERVEQKVAHELLQVRHEHAPIERVCDPSAVHGLADQIPQRTPW